MHTKHPLLPAVLSAAGMAVLILDSRIALEGASEGIDLCIRTVIPALFPFFVISTMLTAALSGYAIPQAAPLEHMINIPQGGISLFLIGILGGYPVGAKSVAQAYRAGALDKSDAQRMLIFCNNAGPAFLFGICAGLFTKASTAWMLWAIQILSAILVGVCLPGKRNKKTSIRSSPLTITEAVNISVKSMAQVCGWVILFRVLILFAQRWFLFILPEYTQTLITGLLELTNGCVALQSVSSEGMRFVMCGLFLSFGGMCVGMQTKSVTQPIRTAAYFPGKCMQSALCTLLCILVQPILFDEACSAGTIPTAILCLILVPIFFLIFRKSQNKSSILEAAHV